ncbi:MAG: ribonuclease HIII [Erysipelothrix sp.]|nr:ribonuclease HIII [Erysipelothrix sp.]
METQVVKMTPTEIKQLKSRYQTCEFRYDIAHTHYQIRGSDFVITAYKSGKVVFQAEDLSLHLPNIKQKKETTYSLPMSGSDEVGTGDYFGPITVCAAIVEEKDLKNIPVNRIIDSKEINDEVIREIAPTLIKHLKHSLLILRNQKYNEIHQKHNINAIKAKLHNQAFLHLETKYGTPKVNILDQFTPEKTYFNYLKDEKEVFRNLIFETKAENKYIAVACGAIIARYAFLLEFDRLSDEYNFKFPKGAGKKVDEKAREFVEIHGPDSLYKVAKYHFKNTERILNNF